MLNKVYITTYYMLAVIRHSIWIDDLSIISSIVFGYYYINYFPLTINHICTTQLFKEWIDHQAMYCVNRIFRYIMADIGHGYHHGNIYVCNLVQKTRLELLAISTIHYRHKVIAFIGRVLVRILTYLRLLKRSIWGIVFIAIILLRVIYLLLLDYIHTLHTTGNINDILRKLIALRAKLRLLIIWVILTSTMRIICKLIATKLMRHYYRIELAHLGRNY
jgi:hypothetical protein